jgi:hypothetical protein
MISSPRLRAVWSAQGHWTRICVGTGGATMSALSPKWHASCLLSRLGIDEGALA